MHSRRVQSVDIKDQKIEILARVASGDQGYLRDNAYIEQQTGIDHTNKESELRQLRSCLDNLSVVTLDNGRLKI